MNREMYKHILGIDDFFKYFPDVHWCHFHEIIEFRWYRQFDYEEWYDKFCIDLTMSDQNGNDSILLTFKNVGGETKDFLSGWISGLDIINLKYNNPSYENQYEIIDFEDSKIHFYCNDIEIKVLRANGTDIITNQDLFDQISNVNNKETFLNFLECLQNDFHTNPQEWENTTIEGYIESIHNWIDDFSTCENNDIDWNNLDYSTLARIFYMGKIYE